MHRIPDGVFEMPPGRARFIREVETALLESLRKWGYREVRTPSMEYFDALALALDEAELDMAFKMVDRATGKMMTLRSDVTPQVARMAALRLADVPRPLRLCYVSSVYRYSADPSYPRREVLQAGAELVGLDDPQADAEVVAMAVAAMEELGLPGVRVSLGQVQYAYGILSECGLSEDDREQVIAAATRKDGAAIAGILTAASAPTGHIDAAMALAELSGGPEALENAHRLAPNDACRRAVDNLESIIDLVGTYGVPGSSIHVDLGELEAFRYHSGLVFSGYTTGAGKAILSGGRYDGLVGKFGRPEQATGFAVDVLEAAGIVSPAAGPAPQVDYLVVNRSGDREKGLCFSMELRQKGRNVLCLIRGLTDRELPGYAKAHGIREVLVIESDGKLYSLDPGSGGLKKRSKKDL